MSRRPASEREIIRAIAAHAGGRHTGLRLGIGDDCAILRPPPGAELLVTTDLLIENVHFRRDWHSPESAGHRCLARGLSDLAAMGARPLSAFLSIAVPAAAGGTWLRRFFNGLLTLAAQHRVPLAGGDTAAAPGGSAALFTADIVLLGSAPRGRALLRSRARPGDSVYVTGWLGGSAAELAQLGERHRTALRRLSKPGAGSHPQLFPQPRLAAGRRLAGIATAAIDLSDGLSVDLAHLCAASGVDAAVDAALLPLHPLARGTDRGLALALHGGEDYELLFTAPAARPVPRVIAGLPVTRIGQISGKGAGSVTLLDAQGRRSPLRSEGWQHFRSSPIGER